MENIQKEPTCYMERPADAVQWNVMPQFRDRHEAFRELDQAIAANAALWFGTVAKGVSPSLREMEGKSLSEYAYVYGDLQEQLQGDYEIYDEEQEMEEFIDIVEDLAESQYSWRIDLLERNVIFALWSWAQHYEAFVDNATGLEETFWNSTLYFLSCFADSKKNFYNPLKIYSYVKKYYGEYSQLHLQLREIYNRLLSVTRKKDNTSPKPMEGWEVWYKKIKILEKEKFRDTVEEVVFRNLSPNIGAKYREEIVEEISELERLAQSDIAYQFLLPAIVAHLYSKYYLKDCVDSDMQSKEDIISLWIEEFETFERLVGDKHQRMKYYRNADPDREQIYQNTAGDHPLIVFMKDFISRLFSPLCSDNTNVWQSVNYYFYENQIKINWLCFYYEHRGRHFKANSFSLEQIGIMWPYVAQYFFSEHKLDFEWIKEVMVTTKALDIPKKTEEIERLTEALMEELSGNEKLALAELLSKPEWWEKEGIEFSVAYEREIHDKLYQIISSSDAYHNAKTEKTKEQVVQTFGISLLAQLIKEAREELLEVFSDMDSPLWITKFLNGF